MELEKQVCSLELAKKLKELEVEQKAMFFWARIGGVDRLTGNKALADRVHNKH